MPILRRTHTCGDLRDGHVGQTVILNGWVNTIRAYPQQVFIDLRDRYGLTQVVVDTDAPEQFAVAKELGREFCLAIHGTVRARLPGKTNPGMATGAVEVRATEVQVLNACPTPPFPVTEFPDEELANEDLRLQYRYLDLRRPSLQRILMLRHQLIKVIRDHLSKLGFLEVETPFLGKSTPEGARDYLVPSRVHNGHWYALPQSPQLYKQLLMVAGYDKYFQIARCMRDEDLRADRQPEFTQLDFEMSFVEQDDVLTVIETLSAEVLKQCHGIEVPVPFPRLTYDDAMLRYGSDKPDLRFEMEIVDVTEQMRLSSFRVYVEVVKNGGRVRGLNVKNAKDRFSNSELKPGGKVHDYVLGFGAKGLISYKVEQDKLLSPTDKTLVPHMEEALRKNMGAEAGDLIILIADREDVVAKSLGALRLFLADKLGLIDPTTRDYRFAWVVDFPSFIWDDEEKRWAANHHPFTAPRDEELQFLETDPGKVKAKAYDLVLNGYEVGGGSIRIHNPDVQARVFKVLGMEIDQARERFGFLLDALKFGAPPHGGIALGIDRWTMILAGTANIRDVIAFPKNKQARDLMTGAPAPVERRQLKELGL